MRLAIFIFCITSVMFSQQIPDRLYAPEIENTVYRINKGTEVYIDEGHNNFHTRENRFLPFAKLIERDGYRVKSFKEKFSAESLKKVKILVISNALEEGSQGPFVVPTKSAFSKKEIKSINTWVKRGGSLFLIADHMPFAGAAADLGKIFGFKFYDSFLFDENRNGIIDFSKGDFTLGSNKITKGRNQKESISKIRTFTGQAFELPEKAESILKVKEEYITLLPDTMWVFSKKTKRVTAKNLSQGAILAYGKGRLSVFGEAAMFTAQFAGEKRVRVGMNSEKASENYQLVLNIIHWLDKIY